MDKSLLHNFYRRTIISSLTLSNPQGIRKSLILKASSGEHCAPHLFLVFHCLIWGNVAGCVYQQRSRYRQVKITKHASIGTNYAILTKRVKVQHEKEPVLYRIEKVCRLWVSSKHLRNLLKFLFVRIITL